jgi:hypothetical protein
MFKSNEQKVSKLNQIIEILITRPEYELLVKVIYFLS